MGRLMGGQRRVCSKHVNHHGDMTADGILGQHSRPDPPDNQGQNALDHPPTHKLSIVPICCNPQATTSELDSR